MSAPDRTAELMDRTEEFWNTHPEHRATLLIDSGYPLSIALEFLDVQFYKLNSWAQRAVTRTVTLMFENSND